MDYCGYWIEYNGRKNTDLDIQVVQRPNIPVPVRRVKYITISGRDGSVTETDGTYEDISIKVLMNYLSSKDDNFMNTARAAKNWLTGSGELRHSDDSEIFYKVKNATIDQEIERALRRAGFFSALFTCDPFSYFMSGKTIMSIDQVKLNPYYLSKPIYYLTGEGMATLTVNDNSLTLNVGQKAIIDTDLMISYREDGTLQRTEGRFDYKDFYLKNGTNNITITGNVNLMIQPNWRSL